MKYIIETRKEIKYFIKTYYYENGKFLHVKTKDPLA